MSRIVKNFKLKIIIVLCCIITALAACIQLSSGSYSVSVNDILNALIDPDIWNLKTISNTFLGSQISAKLHLENPPQISTSTLIIWNIRLPRILVGILVGINLALAGCIFQTITQNQMASPYTLGISQGCRIDYNVNIGIFSSFNSITSNLCNDWRNYLIFSCLFNCI